MTPVTAESIEILQTTGTGSDPIRMGVSHTSATVIVGPWARAATNSLPTDAGVEGAILTVLLQHPWVHELPAGDLRAFVKELGEAVRLNFVDGAPHVIEGVFAAWRHTAEIYADPELRRELSEPLDGTDFGPVF